MSHLKSLSSPAIAIAIATLGALLAGCGTTPPNVQYATGPNALEAGSASHGYLFRFRRSLLSLEQETVAGVKTVKVSVSAAPTELDSDGAYLPTHFISGVDNWRSTTALQVTYIPNTKVVDTIGVKTTSNVVSTIQTVSGVLQALMPLTAIAGLMSNETSAPDEAISRFRASVIDPSIAAQEWTILPNNPGMWYRLTVRAETSLSAEEFFRAAGAGSRAFPIAACSTAALQLGFAPISKETQTLPLAQAKPAGNQVIAGPAFLITIADANRVIPVALPSSGSVRMHSVCGADASEEGTSDRTSILQHLKAAMEEAQKVWKAWDEAKKAPAAAAKQQ